jgi:hypothetical protein
MIVGATKGVLVGLLIVRAVGNLRLDGRWQPEQGSQADNHDPASLHLDQVKLLPSLIRHVLVSSAGYPVRTRRHP